MLLMLNTDNMNKRNEQGQQHGPWEEYYPNGNVMYKANYVNGKKHGLWEEYYANGNLEVIEYYIT